MQRTPLYDAHLRLGAKMVDFGGWAMPVSYPGGIIDEHRATREAVGVFDVCHMGEIHFRGARAAEAVQRLVTNDVGQLADGRALYTVACLPTGGIVDDLIVYRIAADHYLIVVNASNAGEGPRLVLRARPHALRRDRRLGRDRAHRLPGAGRQARAAAAHQAPARRARPLRLRAELRDRRRPGLDRAHRLHRRGRLRDLLRRQGRARALGRACSRPRRASAASRSGSGARDTLRLEARLPLYGNDLDETTTPLEAGLGWVVKLDGADFIGREALRAQAAGAASARKLCGFEMTGRGIARHGYPIFDGEGARAGTATSGGPAPTVGKNIGLGYVPAELDRAGARISVDCRGKRVDAEVVKGPFYKRREKQMSAQQYPDDLYYTKDHEWARLEDRDGQKLATIGITRFAVEQLGDVTQVDLPKEGETVKQAEVFGSVESVKAVSDLFAPLSGKVVKVNSPLADSPEYVNEDPYDEGWMIQIALGDAKELDGLLDAAAYQAFLREQGE